MSKRVREIKVPEELNIQWEKMRTAVQLLRDRKGRIMTVRKNGKEKRYVRPYGK